MAELCRLRRSEGYGICFDVPPDKMIYILFCRARQNSERQKNKQKSAKVNCCESDTLRLPRNAAAFLRREAARSPQFPQGSPHFVVSYHFPAQFLVAPCMLSRVFSRAASYNRAITPVLWRTGPGA